ncbi:Hypothetical_protein [Hexamita inflata]|uniref:Hypothetical_protein n=1 Tax=Hexamita inflata TaxID=28002 RepID=A0AA86PVG9_9EUKA|nr:Hypothetical protein HINF_LOCUS34654 [Hexamita inflata]
MEVENVLKLQLLHIIHKLFLTQQVLSIQILRYYISTTLPCLQGRCYFAYKGVGHSLIRELLHAKPLQASDKYLLFYPVFDHKSFKFDIFQRYILDTFLLIRELKSVTPLQASKHLPYKQGYVVYCI